MQVSAKINAPSGLGASVWEILDPQSGKSFQLNPYFHSPQRCPDVVALLSVVLPIMQFVHVSAFVRLVSAFHVPIAQAVHPVGALSP